MAKVRVLERADGSVGIVYPAPKSRRTEKLAMKDITIDHITNDTIIGRRKDNKAFIAIHSLDELPDIVTGSVLIYTETEQEWLDRVFAKANPTGLVFEDMEDSDLPQDREDRGAWKLNKVAKKVEVDSTKKALLDADKQAKKDAKDAAKAALGLTDEQLQALGLNI